MLPHVSTVQHFIFSIKHNRAAGGENSCSVKGQAILDQEEKEGRREKTRTCAHETHFANLSSKDSCHEYEAAFCVKSCHQPTRLGKRLRLVWL
jgi:hypothetical protein